MQRFFVEEALTGGLPVGLVESGVDVLAINDLPSFVEDGFGALLEGCPNRVGDARNEKREGCCGGDRTAEECYVKDVGVLGGSIHGECRDEGKVSD